MSSAVTSASASPIRRALSQPAFLVISVVLMFSAAILNYAVAENHLYFKKQPVPQPREFKDIPPVLGQWMQVSQDEKLDKEVEDVLGTEKYIYRDYVQVDLRGADVVVYCWDLDHPKAAAKADDSGNIPDDPDEAALRAKFQAAPFDQRVAMIRDALKGRASDECKKMVLALQMQRDDGVVNMGLTYYTGLVDTVAHIPDRCYIADGYEPSSYTTPTWNVAPAGAPAQPLGVHFISFEDQTGNNRVPKCVAYVFQVNGEYQCDPLEVRIRLQNLMQRYGYYAKIELMTVNKEREMQDVDTQTAADMMTQFLTAAKPEIEKCLPDWKKVTQGQ
jgi:hypothetical protein